MLHTKFQNHRPSGSGEGCSTKSLALIGLAVSEKMFQYYGHKYMYIAPGQGQTTPRAQNVFFNINLLSICSFLASFLPFNYIFLFFPIPMQGRPKLTLP